MKAQTFTLKYMYRAHVICLHTNNGHMFDLQSNVVNVCYIHALYFIH